MLNINYTNKISINLHFLIFKYFLYFRLRFFVIFFFFLIYLNCQKSLFHFKNSERKDYAFNTLLHS